MAGISKPSRLQVPLPPMDSPPSAVRLTRPSVVIGAVVVLTGGVVVARLEMFVVGGTDSVDCAGGVVVGGGLVRTVSAGRSDGSSGAVWLVVSAGVVLLIIVSTSSGSGVVTAAVVEFSSRPVVTSLSRGLIVASADVGDDTVGTCFVTVAAVAGLTVVVEVMFGFPSFLGLWKRDFTTIELRSAFRLQMVTAGKTVSLLK